MLSFISSFYEFLKRLGSANLRLNQEQFSLKIFEKLKTASLNLIFTCSYEKSVIVEGKLCTTSVKKRNGNRINDRCLSFPHKKMNMHKGNLSILL